jgi:hypothetical protein
MKAWIRISFLVAFVLCLANADARADEGPSDKIPTGGVLRGAFAEDHYFTKTAKPLHTEGHFIVVPARGIIWSIETPIRFSFVITPQGATQMLGTMALVQVSAEKMPLLGDVTELVTATLAGNWEPLEQQFVVARKATLQHWDATVTPREGVKMPFQSLSFTGNKHVDQARAMRANGGFDKFTFSQQTISKSPPTPAEAGLFQAAAIVRK